VVVSAIGNYPQSSLKIFKYPSEDDIPVGGTNEHVRERKRKRDMRNAESKVVTYEDGKTLL
jgi:hypothetical protein